MPCAKVQIRNPTTLASVAKMYVELVSLTAGALRDDLFAPIKMQ